uniref:Uncharacterized protein n=1 Tax=Mycena chlorophos TaxID=658473 RepID=A0ABQ0M4T6_MYCCL|nr:predicted protein [Mycena chlorophos]
MLPNGSKPAAHTATRYDNDDQAVLECGRTKATTTTPKRASLWHAFWRGDVDINIAAATAETPHTLNFSFGLSLGLDVDGTRRVRDTLSTVLVGVLYVLVGALVGVLARLYLRELHEGGMAGRSSG